MIPPSSQYQYSLKPQADSFSPASIFAAAARKPLLAAVKHKPFASRGWPRTISLKPLASVGPDHLPNLQLVLRASIENLVLSHIRGILGNFRQYQKNENIEQVFSHKTSQISAIFADSAQFCSKYWLFGWYRLVNHHHTLPNGRTFYAKYRRVTKEYLPGSTKIQKTYKGRPLKIKKAPPTYAAAVRRLPAWLLKANSNQPIARPSGSGSAILNIVNRKRKQKGKGISDVARSVANSPYLQEVGKKLLSKGTNSIPSLFRRGTKKIKIKD